MFSFRFEIIPFNFNNSALCQHSTATQLWMVKLFKPKKSLQGLSTTVVGNIPVKTESLWKRNDRRFILTRLFLSRSNIFMLISSSSFFTCISSAHKLFNLEKNENFGQLWLQALTLRRYSYIKNLGQTRQLNRSEDEAFQKYSWKFNRKFNERLWSQSNDKWMIRFRRDGTYEQIPVKNHSPTVDFRMFVPTAHNIQSNFRKHILSIIINI